MGLIVMQMADLYKWTCDFKLSLPGDVRHAENESVENLPSGASDDAVLAFQAAHVE